MSDRELVTLDKAQFEVFDLKLNGLVGAVNALSQKIGPVDKSLNLHKALKSLEETVKAGFADIGKWQSIQNESINAGFKLVAEAIAKGQSLPPPQPQQLEVLMSFIVKADLPDVGYTLTLGEVTDSEGHVIPDAKLSIEISSDNPASVEVTPVEDGRTGNVHFGSPGNATITANVRDEQGDLLGTGVAGFVVTTGDPAAITGVALAFDGLTEAPEEPPAEG